MLDIVGASLSECTCRTWSSYGFLWKRVPASPVEQTVCQARPLFLDQFCQLLPVTWASNSPPLRKALQLLLNVNLVQQAENLVH